MAETIKDIFQMFPRKKYVQATKKKKKKILMSLTTVNYKTSSRCSDNMETTTITTHEKSTEQKLLNDALNRKKLLTFSRTEQMFSIRPISKTIYRL